MWASSPNRPEYIGCTVEEAEGLAASSGLAAVRVLDLDHPSHKAWTMDQWSSRLNLVVRDGRVVLAALF
jgi:hypothetical protein